MYCCCQNSKPNIGHIDVDISDVEQNTKNNEISFSSNKLLFKNKNSNNINNLNNSNDNINKIILNKNNNHNYNMNILNKNKMNDNNSSIYNKISNENNDNININKIINNSSRNNFNQGKVNINNIKSEKFGINSSINNQIDSIALEENKKNIQKESTTQLNNYYNYKNNTILTKMSDNFTYRDDVNEFSNLIYMSHNRNITEEEISSTPKLRITGIPEKFFNKKEIIINAAGILKENYLFSKNNNNIHGISNSKKYISNNSLTNNDIQSNSNKIPLYEKKGISFFGQNLNNKNSNIISINYNREKFNIYNKTEIFFYIYYIRETKKYCLKPNNNSIIFLKLKPKCGYPIKQEEFFCFGSIILMIRRNKSGFNNCLSIDYNQENFIFKDEDYINSNKYIKIGRGKNCDIIIDNKKNISRVNAIIKYNCKLEEWEIYDGDKNNKESLNGVYILLRNKYEINDDCEFEFLGQRFKIQLLYDNKIFESNIFTGI